MAQAIGTHLFLFEDYIQVSEAYGARPPPNYYFEEL